MTQTSIAELRQKAKLPANKAGGSTVQAFFEANKPTLQALLPKHVSPDRMLKIALGALRTTPKLMECTVESLMGAIVWCSQLGLEPNTPMGHAYLIPYRDSKKGVTNVQCIVGFKGLIDLARRSGQIVSIAAHEVCEHDEFEFAYGLDEQLVHKPALSNRGNVIAYYAVAKLQGGGYAFEVMSLEQVEAIRDREGSNAWKDEWEDGRRTGKRIKAKSPWWDHPIEMGRKTVIRRLSKYLPISIEMAEAAHVDDHVGKQKFDNVLDGECTVVAEQEDAADDAPSDEPAQLEHQQHGMTIPTDIRSTERVPTTGGLTDADKARAVELEMAEAQQQASQSPGRRQRGQGGLSLD